MGNIEFGEKPIKKRVKKFKPRFIPLLEDKLKRMDKIKFKRLKQSDE